MLGSLRQPARIRTAPLWLCLLLCWALPTAQGAAAGPVLTSEGQRRARERLVRQATAKELAAARTASLRPYVDQLADTARWLAGLKSGPQAAKIVAEMEKLDPAYKGLAELKAAASAAGASQALTEPQQKELAERLKRAAHVRIRSWLELAERCYKVGLCGAAYDLCCEVLLLDPDEPAVRRAFGQVKAGPEWYDAWEAQQVQRGCAYVPEAGWVPRDAADRVRKGEWFEGGRALTMEQADKLHAEPATPWVIETMHFVLRSTASRKDSVQVAERLEETRRLCFREYLEFFLRGMPRTGAQLLFSDSARDALKVNLYGSREAFLAAVKKIAPLTNQSLVADSSGVFLPMYHVSCFYRDKVTAAGLLFVMQHEVTHQILGESSHGHSAPVWATEGVAEALMYARPGPGGQLVQPRGGAHPVCAECAALLKADKLGPVDELLKYRQDDFHRAGERHRNYVVSGGLCRFFLEVDDGLYARDFLEFLYDAYCNRASAGLTDYVGMDAKTVEQRFKEYLKALGR